MQFNELIARINELARKKRSGGLTAEETLEQQKLYAIYLGNIRSQLKAPLENIEVSAAKKEEQP